MKKTIRFIVIGWSIATFSIALPSTSYSKQASSQSSERSSPVFTDLEKNIIEEFFVKKRDSSKVKESKSTDKKSNKGAKNKKGLPPGLAKKKELPPGLQKQLEKNGKLPPGLDKRDLPTDLQSRLPKLSDELERVIVGDDVMLIEKGVGLIFDILRGAAAK